MIILHTNHKKGAKTHLSSCAQTVGKIHSLFPCGYPQTPSVAKNEYFNTENILTRWKISVKAGLSGSVGFSFFDTKPNETGCYFVYFLTQFFLGFTVNATVDSVFRIHQLKLVLQFLFNGRDTPRIVTGKVHIGSINLFRHLHTLLRFIQ